MSNNMPPPPGDAQAKSIVARMNIPSQPATYGDIANLPPVFDAIKPQPWWVTWRWEWSANEGQWKKPPFNPLIRVDTLVQATPQLGAPTNKRWRLFRMDNSAASA